MQTKVIFGIGRRDAEYFAKLIGRVDAEAVKRDPKTEIQHELFSSLPEQWEQWVNRLRFQRARQATAVSQDGRAVSLRTMTIPPYTATDERGEQIRRESLARYGIPYAEAERNVQETLAGSTQEPTPVAEVPAYEVVTVLGTRLQLLDSIDLSWHLASKGPFGRVYRPNAKTSEYHREMLVISAS